MADFSGKRGLVLGVANKRSIAWAIARRLADGGAQLAFTYQGERIEAGVRELAESVSSPLVTECDVRSDDDVARVFAEVGEAFGGQLDYLVHSVAFAAAEDLEGRFTDTPRDRFWMAVDISAYSLVACARAAEPLMEAGRRRLDRDDDLPRRRARRAALQRDGRGEGDARRVGQVPRLGPRPEEHPRERDLGRPGAHAGRPLDRGLRDDGGDRRGARAAPPPDRRRRRRRRPRPTCSRTTRGTSPRRRSTSTPGTTRSGCRLALQGQNGFAVITKTTAESRIEIDRRADAVRIRRIRVLHLGILRARRSLGSLREPLRARGL